MNKKTLQAAIDRLIEKRQHYRRTDDFKDAKWRLGLNCAIRELKAMLKE